MRNDTNALKPCPLCGSEAKLDFLWDNAYVVCTNLECMCRTKFSHDAYLVIDLWNRRVDNEG